LLDELGPLFAVDLHDDQNPSPPWRLFAELIGDSEVLGRRVEAVRVALARDGQVEPRVAASVTQLGLVARLLAPALAAEVLGHRPFDLRADTRWWQDQLGGPFPVSVTFAPEFASLAGSAVEQVTQAVGNRYALSSRVLWGNVASAVNGAANQIMRQRPELTERATRVATAWLTDPRLAGERAAIGPGFRRSSCCLIYRIAGAGPRAVCGDCVLQPKASASS
jgi:hypothetical protein